MLESAETAPGSGYGLGVDVAMQNGRFMIEHSGEVSGFTAENIVFPEDSVAIVVLTNQDARSAAGHQRAPSY